MAYAWYKARLAARPLLTQSISTAVLFGTGDVIAQQIVEARYGTEHHFARTARMTAYGGLVFGPAATKWFAFLQRKVSFPNYPNLEILTKVGLDQGVFASTNLVVFLTYMSVLEGTDPKEKLRNMYFSTLQKNYMVWPPAQFINFKYVPLEHRVLVVNVVALGWNCYLSYLNSGGGQSSGKEKSYESQPPSG